MKKTVYMALLLLSATPRIMHAACDHPNGVVPTNMNMNMNMSDTIKFTAIATLIGLAVTEVYGVCVQPLRKYWAPGEPSSPSSQLDYQRAFLRKMKKEIKAAENNVKKYPQGCIGHIEAEKLLKEKRPEYEKLMEQHKSAIFSPDLKLTTEQHKPAALSSPGPKLALAQLTQQKPHIHSPTCGHAH